MPDSFRWAVRAAFITAVTALGAITAVTIPGLSLVPFTFQVFGVFLAGGLLPARWAFMSQAAYLALGVLGAPVFAEGQRGFAVLVGPFGGYLWAYPVAALAMAWIIQRRPSKIRIAIGLMVALLVIYGGGVTGLVLATTASWMRAVMEGVVPFIGWDIAKALLVWPILIQVGRWMARRTSSEARLSA